MDLKLTKKDRKIEAQIDVTGSKSESNRLLLLQALYPNISIENLSNSDDTSVMRRALASHSDEIDIHHAGTAMRFLCAFFAIQDGKTITITGSQRMKERPIKVLVDALNALGAHIEYTHNEGFPPLRIKGKTITTSQISLKANISSQYISALMLIAPRLKNGLEITLQGEVTSAPYIRMTLEMLTQLGVEASFIADKIRISPQKAVADRVFVVESDWSSASYFYSFAALSDLGSRIVLSSYRQESLQGDSTLVQLYKNFGVETGFYGSKIELRKVANPTETSLKLDLINTPDIAQTLAVTCFGMGMRCAITGLHTLRIKETDRLSALKKELEKLGAEVEVTDTTLTLKPLKTFNENKWIATYNDHRMAMSFAPLALRGDIGIERAEEASKSYPDFWKDVQKLGVYVHDCGQNQK